MKIFILSVVLLVSIASSQTPIAAFSGMLTSSTSTLSISFIDAFLGNPFQLVRFLGDETNHGQTSPEVRDGWHG